MAIRTDNIRIVLDIEAKEGVKAFQKLMDESRQVNNEMRKLKRLGKENTEEFKRLEKRASELNKELAELGGAGANMGQLIARSKQLNRELKSLVPGTKRFIQVTEELKQVNTRLRNIRNQSKGVTDELTEMRIAGIKVPPVLQKMAGGVNAMQTAFKAFLALEVIRFFIQLVQIGDQTAKQFRELRGEIERLTGSSGEATDEFATRINALALTYKKDTSEILIATNALTKQLTGDFSKSLDLIEKGFLAGADKSKDFLDQVKEYPAFFREARLSGEQYISVISQSVQEGVFSDKGVDLLKEFELRVRELPQATNDALKAIGISSAEIGKEIEENGIGGAFTLVQEKLNDFRDDAPEVGQALADIFGGPGEDAGIQFIKNLQLTDDALNNLIDTGNDYTAAMIDQLEANQELSAAQNEVAKRFNDTSNSLNVYITRVKAFLFNFAAGVLEFFEELPATASGVQAAFKQILENIQGFFERTRIGLTITLKRIEKLNPFGKTSEQLDQEISNLKNKREEIKDAAGSVAKAYRKAYLDGLEDVETRKAVSQALTPPPDPEAVTQAAKRNAKIYVDKEAEELAKLRAERQKDAGLLQPLQDIGSNQSDTVQSTGQGDGDSTAQEERLKNRFLQQLITEQQYEEQRFQLLQNSYDTRLEYLRQKHGEESAQFIALENEKLEHQRSYEEQRAELTKRTEETRIKATQAGLQAFNSFVDSTIELLSEEEGARKKNALAIKAFESAKIIVAGISEVQQIWKNSAQLGPFGQIVAIAQTAAAAARTGVALNKVAQAKFYHGGHTGDKVLMPDAYGGAVGVVHKNEWVAPDWMTEHPIYGQAISWLEQMRQRGFKDGGFTTVDTTPSLPTSQADATPSANESKELIKMMVESNDRLEKAILAKQFTISTGQVRDAMDEDYALEEKSGF